MLFNPAALELLSAVDRLLLNAIGAWWLLMKRLIGLNRELEDVLRDLSLARCWGMCWVLAPEHQEEVELTGETLPPHTLLLESSLSKIRLFGWGGTLMASSLSLSSNWSFLFILDWTIIEDMSEPFELKSNSFLACAELVMSARLKAPPAICVCGLMSQSMLVGMSSGDWFRFIAMGAFRRLVPGVRPVLRTDLGVLCTASWISE